MKHLRFLLVVMLPLILALAAFSVSAETVERPEWKTTALHKRAWFLACAWSRYSCRGLERPQVEYKPLRDGLYGAYWRGSDTILLNESVIGKTIELIVLVHETVHYLQFHNGAWATFSKAVACGLEKEAFNVGARVASKVYKAPTPSMRGWDATRALSYGCSYPNPDAAYVPTVTPLP